MNKKTAILIILAIFILLGVMVVMFVINRKKESFASTNAFKVTLNDSNIACNRPIPSKRYMYMPIPPSRNSSYDVRNPPIFTKDTAQNLYNGTGIFLHTDIFGNYANERICPDYDQMEAQILS